MLSLGTIVCTLTWWNGPTGYEVFFNRDERKSRLPAIAPQIHSKSDCRFIAPIDGNAGGTWLASNETGLTVAILNFYEQEVAVSPAKPQFRSRGQLMLELARRKSLEAVNSALVKDNLSQYQAFTLIAFSDQPNFAAWKWRWDGSTLLNPDKTPSIPVCSSSFLTKEVVQHRHELLKKMTLTSDADSETLARFHHEDDSGNPSAHTVLMNRPDAQTWSISRIHVGSTEIDYQYEALPTDQRGESTLTSHKLPRS